MADFWWIPHISVLPLKDMFIRLSLPNDRVDEKRGIINRRERGRERGMGMGRVRRWVQVFSNSW